jgi:secreted Zn-dependent insulinase-like peptidase
MTQNGHSWRPIHRPTAAGLADARGLLQDNAAVPALIHSSAMVQLWHKPDPSFRVPKAVLYINLQLPGALA